MQIPAAVERTEAFVPLPLATDLSAGSVVGEYNVDCKLGDGGMATVYGATHPLIGKKAAIKVMNPALSLDAGRGRALRPRGARGQRHRPPQHRRRLQLRPAAATGAATSSWSGCRARRSTIALWERRPTLDEALDIARPDLRRARGRARQGHRPPRPQAGQRLPGAGARAARSGQAARLRRRQADRTADGLDGSDRCRGRRRR